VNSVANLLHIPLKKSNYARFTAVGWCKSRVALGFVNGTVLLVRGYYYPSPHRKHREASSNARY
jgi:hypothetical protein